MILHEAMAIFGAGLAAGLVNAVAGGGTLLSFPLLLWLGRDPIVANATNAVALWPGSLAGAYGFRRELAGARPLLRALVPPSIAGGALGAVLLLVTPARLFSTLVPYLILLATVLIALKRPLLPALRRQRAGLPDRHALLGLGLGQFVVAIYGGYFGAAMGIMMLASLGLAGLDDIHQRNGLKNVLSTVINGLAGVVFVLGGAVVWSDAVVLALGAVVGGLAGAAFGRRLSARSAETLVVIIGLIATGAQLMRR